MKQLRFIISGAAGDGDGGDGPDRSAGAQHNCCWTAAAAAPFIFDKFQNVDIFFAKSKNLILF